MYCITVLYCFFFFFYLHFFLCCYLNAIISSPLCTYDVPNQPDTSAKGRKKEKKKREKFFFFIFLCFSAHHMFPARVRTAALSINSLQKDQRKKERKREKKYMCMYDTKKEKIWTCNINTSICIVCITLPFCPASSLT